jgi:hypothetical protein
MYVIIPNGTLIKGDPFPIIDIPTDVVGTAYTDFELEDFQWWAYSKPFNDWFKTSGRSWQASESEIMSDGDALVERWKAEKVKDGKPIMSFLDFVNESIRSEYIELFEKGPEGEASSEGTGITQQDQIKFLFAYNKLVRQGAIQTTFDMNTDFNVGDEKAFFLTVVQEDAEEQALNMKAFKFKAKTGASSGAGRLAQGTVMYPGAPYKIPPDATSNFIVTKIQQDLSSLGTWATGMLASWGIYNVAAAAGGGFLLYRVLNGWKFASAVKAIGNAGGPGTAQTIANLLRGGRAARGGLGIFGKVGKSVGSYIFKEGLGTAKAFKAARQAWKFGVQAGVKPAMRLLNTSKAFLRGTVAGGARLIPVLGWVLLAVDAVGSMINWYSDNQAPRAGEAVKLFDAKEVFSPSSIEVGESIVLCWSQPDSSTWGAVLSFVVSNMGETRTILEMTKIIEDSSGYSVFILQSANSESLNEQLKGNLLTLVAIPNSAKLDNGIVDADEIKGRICSVTKGDVNAEGDAIPVPFDFQGVCNWDTLVSAVESSEGVFFKADPNAPATYEFNFEDMDGDRINVVGTLVTDEDLANLTNDDIKRIFYGGIDTGNSRRGEEAESEEGEEDMEDLETEETNESSRVVNFESFKSGRLYESGEEEDTSDVLEAFQGPAFIAIYVCDEPNSKAYASREIGKKKRLPQFTNFAINPDNYNARPGTTIELDVNSDEDIEDPKAGYAEYREGSEVDREVVIEEPTEGGEGGEGGTGGVQAGDAKIIAPDITKKERKHSTVIKDGDKDGGINLMDEFLTTEDKGILGISDWDKITMVKARYDNSGEISKIIIRNKDAEFMKKSKEYTPEEIESFEIAKKLLQSAQSRLEVKK